MAGSETPVAEAAVDADVPNSRTWAWTPWVASGAVVLATSANIVRYSLPELAGRYMADDAFYYLVIADRFPALQFNEGISTTGLHPLWWLLLSLVTSLGFDAVRAALLLALVLHIATGFVLRQFFADRWASATVANIAAAIWIVHPAARSIALIGVESSLIALVLALVLVATTRQVDERTSLWAGAAIGLAFLSRTDSVILTLLVAAVWLWGSSWRNVARTAVAAATLAIPWLLVLLAHGGLTQDSSAALAEMRRQVGSFGRIAPLLDQFVTNTANLAVLGREWGWLPRFGAVAASAALIAAVRMSRIEAALLTGAIVLHLAQAHQLGVMREWYAVYLLFVLVVLLAPRAVLFTMRLPAPSLQPFGPVLVGLAVVVVGLWQLPALFPQEQGKWEAAEAASRIVPPDAEIAAFNTGIYQWVMPNNVVNLDGVVNPDVLPHIADRSVCRYVTSLGTEYVIDSLNGARKAEVVAPGLLDGALAQALPTTGPSNETLWILNDPDCGD